MSVINTKNLTPERNDERIKYCSSKCQRQHHRMDVIYTCKHCGKEFSPKSSDRITYCSRECAFADKKVRTKVIKTDYEANCLLCGKQFRHKRYSRYCSDDCRKEVARIKAREYQNKYKAARVVNEFVTKTCKECGCVFTTNFMANSREYCSDVCARKRDKAVHKANRKEQFKKAFVQQVYFSKIYKRDKVVCQICGKPVIYDKNPKDSMAATIDHIVPLSKGGKHHPDNCQLAHRICNSYKGVKIAYRINA